MDAIQSGGSVTVSIAVYDDFKYYSGGLYDPSPISNFTNSAHAVRLFGWGVRICNDGTSIKYWSGVSLIPNSMFNLHLLCSLEHKIACFNSRQKIDHF